MKLKQPFRRLLSLLLTTSLLSAEGTCFRIGPLTYTNYGAEAIVKLTGCLSSTTGELIIPESVEYNGLTYSVTSIGDYAFWGCCLTSVTIPSSVTNIGESAFYECSSLTSITIPNSVTSIGNSVFRDCSSLTSVTIPNFVASIGDETFAGCSSLTSVTIPNAVTSIGNAAFSGCSSLTSVTIPGSVTAIGISAFYGCSNLTSVLIPNSVTTIGDCAFEGCSGLTSVAIPGSVTSIGIRVFGNCSGLANIQVESGNPEYCSLDGVLFNSDKSELVAFPANRVGEYQIPSSVTTIGAGAFWGCSSLASVTIPSSVSSIGGVAFWGCSSLTNIEVESGNPNYCSIDGILFNSDKSELVTFPAGRAGEYQIPSSVTSIGYDAFNCCSMTSVTIPSSVTSISYDAFYFCERLKSIYLFGKSTDQLPVESVYTFYDNGYHYDNAVYLVGEITTTQSTAEFDVQKVGLVESFDFEYVDSNGAAVKETVNQSGRVSLGNLPTGTTLTLKVTVHMVNGEAYEYNSEITTKEADDQSAIEVVEIEEADGFDVYTLSGVCVCRNATDLSGLRPGIYIANGRKFIVR